MGKASNEKKKHFEIVVSLFHVGNHTCMSFRNIISIVVSMKYPWDYKGHLEIIFILVSYMCLTFGNDIHVINLAKSETIYLLSIIPFSFHFPLLQHSSGKTVALKWRFFCIPKYSCTMKSFLFVSYFISERCKLQLRVWPHPVLNLHW